MRDFQRSKVYQWEWAVLRYLPQNWMMVTVGECQVLVEKIWLREEQTRHAHRSRWCRQHDVPIVTDGRGRTSAGSKRGTIAIPRQLRQSVVVCHEVAHEMLPYGIGHTENFVSTFITVLNNNLGISKDALIETAMDFKVKMNHDLL